jgi:hypothetical protein
LFVTNLMLCCFVKHCKLKSDSLFAYLNLLEIFIEEKIEK